MSADCPECIIGVAFPMNEIGEIQRCDSCRVFAGDDAAAEHLAEELNKRLFPDDVGAYAVECRGGRYFLSGVSGRLLDDDDYEPLMAALG